MPKIVVRPASYATLSYEQRMAYIRHRATIFHAKPAYWFSGWSIV